MLSASDVASLEPQGLGDLSGISRRILHRDETTEAGILRVAAGRRLGRHTHRANQHHMWVLDGEADVAGVRIGPGGYAHIPAGVEHDIDATLTEGCTVVYLYVR